MAFRMDAIVLTPRPSSENPRDEGAMPHVGYLPPVCPRVIARGIDGHAGRRGGSGPTQPRDSPDVWDGVRFGIAHTAVKPPRAAAAVPVAMVSLYEKPGSRRCT